jgi:hypothetical protein
MLVAAQTQCCTAHKADQVKQSTITIRQKRAGELLQPNVLHKQQ